MPWSQDSGSVFQAKKPGCPPRVWPMHWRTGFPAKSEEGSCCCTEGSSSSGGRSARPWGNQERHCWGIFPSLFPSSLEMRNDFSSPTRWGARTSVSSFSSRVLFAVKVISAGELNSLSAIAKSLFPLGFQMNHLKELQTNEFGSCFLKTLPEVPKSSSIPHKDVQQLALFITHGAMLLYLYSTCFILLVSGCCFCMSVIFWHGCTLIPLSYLCFLPFFVLNRCL